MRPRTFVVLSFGLTLACGRTGLDAVDFRPSVDGGAGLDGGGKGAGGGGAAVGQGGNNGSGGLPVVCVVDKDCLVQEICLTPKCVSERCVFTFLDDDHDGYSPFACGGDDCDDHNGSANPIEKEQCTDGIDNDCNGAVDCADVVCAGTPVCGSQAQPPLP